MTTAQRLLLFSFIINCPSLFFIFFRQFIIFYWFQKSIYWKIANFITEAQPSKEYTANAYFYSFYSPLPNGLNFFNNLLTFCFFMIYYSQERQVCLARGYVPTHEFVHRFFLFLIFFYRWLILFVYAIFFQ